MNTPFRILTGHLTTGPRHLGHLVGTLTTWIDLQIRHECFFLVADLHTLTTGSIDPQTLRRNVLELTADWIATGIDPRRAVIFLQSAVPQHAQLSLLLGMLVSEARLHHIPTYKEQIRQLHLQPTLGFLSYPVLQAADILLYKADMVPVGEDQLPHLELAREIARRFNRQYGPTFSEPQAILSSQPRLPGIDNRTMHTSYGNAIYIKDTPEETTRKVMRMYTDPARIHAHDPGKVDGNPVFTYLDAFGPDPAAVSALKERYTAGAVGDVDVKRYLAEVLNTHLQPIRERRTELIADSGYLSEILAQGSRRARETAARTLDEVYQRMGLGIPVQSASPSTLAPLPSYLFC